MNFKRYHVSKNLFDKSNTDLIFTGTTLAVVNEWSGGGGISKVIRIPCEPLTTYTISGESESSILRISLSELETAPDPVSGSVGCIDVLKSSSVSTQTFTTTANTKYILVQVSAAAFDDYINVLMLNTGSQPLPYEPYSSEVWHDIPHYIMGTSTDTLTTLPADIYANDTTATVGLKGNMEQTGTPSPTTPIQPQECGDYSNLFNEATAVYGKYIDGNGVEQTSSTGENNHSDYIPVKSGEQYTLAETKPYYDSIVSAIAWYTSSKVFIRRDSATLPNLTGRTSNTWTAPSNAVYAIINFYRYPNFDGENDMLNEGSTPLPYESYGQYKIPILSNSTTTNIYLGEVQSTRKIKKLVLTGEENWVMSVLGGHNGFLTYAPQTQIGVTNCICSHYKVEYSNTNNTIYFIANPINGRFVIFDDRYSSTDDFKAYLQQQYANGTPVTVWYVLATPETATINEPLMKIGDYADEVTGITIPTIAGANTLSIGTTLQPSEVSVNYHGWHPVADVHERDNGAWT